MFKQMIAVQPIPESDAQLRVLLRERLLANVGEKRKGKLEKLMARCHQSGCLATLDELYECAATSEAIKKDWVKGRGSKVSVAKSYMPDVFQVSDEEEGHQEEAVKRANFRRIQERRPENTLEQVHRDRNHYMKCFLNRMVEDRISRVQRETRADIDSEEEQVRIAIMKAELPDDDPKHDMTAEDACLFWGNVPDDVARFELQLEKTERQAAEHRGRSSRRWKRGKERHQVASMRPQMAWKYRQERERAMKTIGGELPRYADYAKRDNSTMSRRDPSLDYEEEEVPAELRPHQGRGQPEYAPSAIPKGQILSRSLHHRGKAQEETTDEPKNQPRKGWKWCKHCGYDGAKDWRDPSKPPVDTIPTEEGYILVQPGSEFLAGPCIQRLSQVQSWSQVSVQQVLEARQDRLPLPG